MARLSRGAILLGGILGATLLAYADSLQGGLLFDDLPSVRDNRAIQAGDWWGAAFGSLHSPIANRPLVCLSLVLDRALWGPAPAVLRAGNLLLHLAAVALVFAVGRRVLRAPNLGARFDERGAALAAAAVAALWAVHPLGVDAVCYITQRTTLLMSACLLTALYCVLRADAGRHRTAWRAAAVGLLCAGMASKEEMVAAPLLLPLFDRAFLVPSWRGLRARVPFYLAAAASWLVLLLCVAAGPPNPTVGYATTPRATAIEWLMTQAPVVAHYVRLGAWPHPLRGFYDWSIVREFAAAALPGAFVVALLLAAVLAWRRQPAWGWLGAMFFLLLAPTSTVLPIVTEIAAERRMYLPVLAVIAPAALGLAWLVRRSCRHAPAVLTASTIAAVVAGVWLTRQRVAVYASEATFWADAYERRQPGGQTYLASLLLASYGKVVREGGDLARASELFAQAVACDSPPPTVRLYHAMSLVEQGRDAEAAATLRSLAAGAPRLADEWAHQAMARLQAGRAGAPDLLGEAETAARLAVGLAPQRADFTNLLGLVLDARGRAGDAEAAFRRAIDQEPRRIDLRRDLADLLQRTGRIAEAAAVFADLIARFPDDAALAVELANDWLRRGDAGRARAVLQDLLQRQPDAAQARALLQTIEARERR